MLFEQNQHIISEGSCDQTLHCHHRSKLHFTI